MRKLKSFLCALMLTLSFTVPVLAGNIPIGGYCDSAECVQSNPAPRGYEWSYADGLYFLASIF
jgi:hypothetical protein